jgi:hypothetical protein
MLNAECDGLKTTAVNHIAKKMPANHKLEVRSARRLDTSVQ